MSLKKWEGRRKDMEKQRNGDRERKGGEEKRRGGGRDEGSEQERDFMNKFRKKEQSIILI